MTQSYTARKVYSNAEERRAFVTSTRCQYTVWLSEDIVSLDGPGVDESSDDEDFDRFDNFEDFALHIVLLFENGLWPEE